MKNNNVLIIGAGIGGLAVGIRLAAEGFRVRSVEKNEIPFRLNTDQIPERKKPGDSSQEPFPGFYQKC